MASSEGAAAETKKRKRQKVDLSKFADLEAEEVGGSGGEEEESDDEQLIDNSEVPDTDAARSKMRKKINQELKELKQDIASRGPLQGAARLFSSARLDDMEQRYQEMEEAGKRGEDVSKMTLDASVQQTVTVPEATDPRLWCLKTFAPEEELCIKLMYNAFRLAAAGDPVPVYSIFTVPYVRSYIYIEAHREADVRRFTKGITGVSQYSGLSLVPIDQMAGVFSAAMSAAQKVTVINPGDWVRLKKGPYRGDLAQVEEVDEDNYVLKLKPRIQGGQLAKNNKKIFPPKWFHKGDLEAAQQVLVNEELRRTQKGFKLFYVVDGETYRDGFLYKNFRSTNAFVSGPDARPTEYELQDWRNAPPISEQVRPKGDISQTEEEERDPMPPPALPPKALGPVLEDGEEVIVHSGDLKNLRATVTKAVYGSPTVLVQPRTIEVKGNLSIAVSRLCKYFQQGDYVVVTSGEHAGDAGHIEKVDLGSSKTWGSHVTARILASDYTSFRASLNDLRRSAERPESHNQMGEFRVGQLVMVSGQDTRALIVRLEAGGRAMVLGTNNSKKYVSLSELTPVNIPRRRFDKEQVWCEDKKKQRLVLGCVVKAPHSYTGSAPICSQVLFIHGGWVFLRAIDTLVGERAFLVAPGDKCEFVYDPDDLPKGKGKGKGGKGKRLVPDKTEEELSSKALPFGQVKKASEVSFLKRNYHAQLGWKHKLANGPSGGELQAGGPVKITGGNYKGMRGEIRDLLHDRVRISLMSQPKLVEVSVHDVREDDYTFPKRSQVGGERNPGTPWLPPMPAPKADKSAEQLLADSLEGVQAPTDEQAWDPSWLTEAVEGAEAAPLTPAVSIVSSRRRRKQPRLPAEVTGATPISQPGTPL